MKKTLSIILLFVFIFSIVTTSFASSTITYDMYEWITGAWNTGWPDPISMTFMGNFKEGYVMLKDTAAAGSVQVTLDDKATGWTVDPNYGPTETEIGFYFMADVTAIKGDYTDPEKVTDATVDDAYLAVLDNYTLEVVLYRVTNGVKTELMRADIDNYFNISVTRDSSELERYSRCAIVLTANFADDGKVSVYADPTSDENGAVKIIDYTPKSGVSVPAGNKIMLSGKMLNSSFSHGCAEAMQVTDYSSTCTHSEKIRGDFRGHWRDVCCNSEDAPEAVELMAHDTEGDNYTCSVCGYDPASSAYNLEIYWGDMRFDYVVGEPVWDDEKLEWIYTESSWEVAKKKGNCIKAINYSGNAVEIGLDYSGVAGGIEKGTFSYDGSEIDSFDLASREVGKDAACKEITFMPVSELVATEANKNEYVVVGNITLSIKEKISGEEFATVNNGNAVMLYDGLTTVTISADANADTKAFTYGKIIKLEHQSDDKKNGILIATNENVKGAPWDIYISYDDGKTWQVSDSVVDTVNTGMSSGYQPYLFELPVDIGSYKKGTILLSGCSYSSTATKLPLFASTDRGKSWIGLHNISEGGAYNQGGWSSEGVWEPCLVYDDVTKRLYCFYSDEQVNGIGEDHVGGYSQRIVYKYTEDLKTWSDEYNAVAIGGDTRPGMAMVTKMGNGQWALAYEYVGNPVDGGTLVYIKFTDDIGDWTPSDPGKLIQTNAGQCFGSSPAIAWTPSGGDCGTLIATGSGNVNGTNGTKCDLFLSFDYGKTFTTVKNVIPVAWGDWDSYTRSGYSAGFFVDPEGVVYYVNNPPYVVDDATYGTLMFTKIKFVEQ